MNTSHDPAALTVLLNTELHCAAELLHFLQREAAELAGSNHNPLVTENDAKLGLIDALQQATASRLRFMAAHDLPTDLQTVEADNSGTFNDRERQLFSEVLALAQQCFEENRQVGQLINRRSQFVTQILQSLNAAAPDPQAETYGEDGNTSSGSPRGSKDLARI